MPAWDGRRHAAALAGYLSVALLFAWPLPLHLSDALLGPVSGDTGVYVWNLWLFRHEIVAHHHYPFLTFEILSLAPRVPLALHNYTTFANLLAFPLLPMLGTVATFNVLTMFSQVLAAYAMFLLARDTVRDTGASWLAGLLFGFSPLLSARVMAHFSLVQAAPLPLFALVLVRMSREPTLRLAAAAGAIVGWAFLCDPYYAIYCLLMAAFMAFHFVVMVEQRPRRWIAWRFVAIDFALLCIAGLIAGIMIRGGGRVHMLGIRVSVRGLYTPVMVFTALAAVRAWLTLRPRFAWVRPPLLPSVRVVFAAAAVCAVLVAPVLYATGESLGQRSFLRPQVYWRSSPPGMDVLAFFTPNPTHPLWRGFGSSWSAHLPNGVVENIGAIPWVAIAVIAIAVFRRRFCAPRVWVVFTALAGLLSLGPFIRIAGHTTYAPTPWALVRYVPVIGAARMPTRLAILVMLGVAMVFAFALRHLRETGSSWRVPVVIGALLLFELLPAPRVLYSARVPEVYRMIAADPRPVRVLTLPFGMRDGMRSLGNYTAASQFYQTVHEKQLVGGYVSRLPRAAREQYRSMPVIGLLMDLSEGQTVLRDRIDAAIRRAHERRAFYNIGYVVFDRSKASQPLMDFARAAFDLQYIAKDGDFELYSVPEAER
jgi:hypothetical protein